MGFFDGLKSLIAGGAMPSGDDFHEYDDGGGRPATVKRNDQTEYYSNAYRACALAKARPLASLPIHVYERVDGSRVESGKRFAKAYSDILRKQWNPFMSAQEGYRWLDMTKDAKGNAFARLEMREGMPVAIWPMSGVPRLEIAPGGKAVFTYGGDRFTKPGRYLEEEVIWVKSPIVDPDTMMGVSLAELAARELGLSIDLEEFYARLLSNGNHFPRWLETDQKLDENSYNRLKKQVSDGEGILSAGKMRIFDAGLTVKSANLTMADMSLVEQEKWILQQTCRTLSVPPQEVFDLSNATYSNIEQGALNFANKTLVPECAEIERALSKVLWCAGLDDCYVQFDMNGLLRGNYRDRMEGYRIGIYAGIMCQNEVRAKEELPPYEGGEKFMRPTAYAVVDPETGEVTYPASAAKSAEQGASGEGTPSQDGADAAGALDAVHADMRARIRDRLQEGGDTPKFRDFATRVLKPYAQACTLARIPYDIQADIEEIVSNEGH